MLKKHNMPILRTICSSKLYSHTTVNNEQRNNVDTFTTFNNLLITVLFETPYPFVILRFDGLLTLLFFHFHYFGSKI